MNDQPAVRGISFGAACLIEISLLVIAWVISWISNIPLWRSLFWDPQHLLIGLSAALPLFVGFVWMLDATPAPTRNIRLMLDRFLRPAMEKFTIPQLAVVSLLAGVCEETLFRDAIQASLTQAFGIGLGIFGGALLFGLAHLVTLLYAAVTITVGILLGWIAHQTGNLLAPIVTHAVYDFTALVYYLRATQPLPLDPSEETDF